MFARGEAAGRKPGRGASPGSLRSPLPARRTVRTALIHSGWEELDKPSGGFFKGGKEGGSPRPARAPHLTSRATEGPGLAVGPGPARPLSLGYPLARVALRFLAPSLPTGEREGSRPARPPEREGAGRPAVRCPRRAAVSGFHTNPTGGVRRHPRSPDCAQGRGEPAQELPGSGDLEFGRSATGFSAFARPLFEPPSRARHPRKGLAETFPTSPGPWRCDLPSRS